MLKVLSKKSTSGIQILGIQRNERIQWLVSQHNPQREAERLIQSSIPCEFCVLFGWGSGLAAQVALRHFSRVLVIEPSFLETPGFAKELQRIAKTDQQRLDIIWWNIDGEESGKNTSDEESYLKKHLGSYFFSLLASKITTIQLPGYRSAFPRQSRLIQPLIHEVIEESTKEFGIFQVFGNLWLENYLRNIPTILEKEELSQTFTLTFQHERKSIKQIVALGAGPSLHSGIAWLKHQTKSTLVFAADTCAPALAGLENPHLKIVLFSLDAQWYTHLHSRWITEPNFLGWILDGSVNPTIFRSLPNHFAIFSNHPLIGYFDTLHIDPDRTRFFHSQSGLAALETAQYLSKIDSKPLKIFGVDGMFKDFRAYSSGTYLDPWLLSKNTRRNSRETQDFSLMSRGRAQSISWSPKGYQSSFYVSQQNSDFGSRLLHSLSSKPKTLFEKNHSFGQFMSDLLDDFSTPYTDPTTLHTQPTVPLVLPGAIKLYQQQQTHGTVSFLTALELNRGYLFSLIGKLSKV